CFLTIIHQRRAKVSLFYGGARINEAAPLLVSALTERRAVAMVHHRWYAGCPFFTATKIPRQVAQTFPPALNVPSTVARSPVRSTTLAERKIESFVGVGRSNLIAYSAVTVHGGRSSFARFIR